MAPHVIESGKDMTRTLSAAIVLLAFTAFSLWVIATQGYFGFLHLARAEPWGLQLLLDLAIALAFGLTWLVRDARARGLTAWPYVVATLAVGSISILAYVVIRAWLSDRRTSDTRLPLSVA